MKNLIQLSFLLLAFVTDFVSGLSDRSVLQNGRVTVLNKKVNQTFQNIAPKRTGIAPRVEGCFSLAHANILVHDMGLEASNGRCQDYCREKGLGIAATKGSNCFCSYYYPAYRRITDNQCNTRCRSYLPCYSVEECCGGAEAYTVSYVGDFDVAKLILGRLAQLWQTNLGYRNYVKSLVSESEDETTKVANWWSSFDKKGWSKCPDDLFLTGLYRNDPPRRGNDKIYLLEQGLCKSAPCYLNAFPGDQDCKDLDIGKSFNKKGWAICPKGYYMTRIYRSGGDKLKNIEKFKCCRPHAQQKKWGSCYVHNAWESFNKKGWTVCSDEHYLAGLYRNKCEWLYCLEQFYCCKMGPADDGYFLEKPSFSITMKGMDGVLNECKTSLPSENYSCKQVSSSANLLTMKPVVFKIEEKKEPDVVNSEPVDNFQPIICPAAPFQYTCSKKLTSAIKTKSFFHIGTGLNVRISSGTAVPIFGFDQVGGPPFSDQVTLMSSFNTATSRYITKEISNEIEVSIPVQPNQQLKIDLRRKKKTIFYKWKGSFQPLGKYQIKWKKTNGLSDIIVNQDITTALSGSSPVAWWQGGLQFYRGGY